MSKTADQVKPNNAPSYCALYPGLAEICVKHGYALAIHGSMSRDFDLIAVPWVESPSAPEAVIDAICSQWAIHYIKSETNPQVKPHGRVAHTLCVMGDWQMDLSFMPVQIGGFTLRTGPSRVAPALFGDPPAEVAKEFEENEIGPGSQD